MKIRLDAHRKNKPKPPIFLNPNKIIKSKNYQTNGEQICLSLFWVLIMEASVLGGQHGSEKTMGNTSSPPCVCCETQIGGGCCGFLPYHSPPPATIKVASLISPSISSFLGLTHSVPLSLLCDGVGSLGCSMVQNMFELWLKFDSRIWW